ncbi:MAG: hypothetical protein HQL06_17255 [Nitrospirae bacterium]|nr:hypothetical protein [Nitrospirota bacterium]
MKFTSHVAGEGEWDVRGAYLIGNSHSMGAGCVGADSTPVCLFDGYLIEVALFGCSVVIPWHEENCRSTSVGGWVLFGRIPASGGCSLHPVLIPCDTV